jgi:hypothetical protein
MTVELKEHIAKKSFKICATERQLQLEKIDAENKVKGFKLTQKKYEDLWKKLGKSYFNFDLFVARHATQCEQIESSQ